MSNLIDLSEAFGREYAANRGISIPCPPNRRPLRTAFLQLSGALTVCPHQTFAHYLRDVANGVAWLCVPALLTLIWRIL